MFDSNSSIIVGLEIGTSKVCAVVGDYKSVIQFLNGVQRSPNLYEVDALVLATESANQGPSATIKVSVHLKTYFRTAS